jgi:hypothetical protein
MAPPHVASQAAYASSPLQETLDGLNVAGDIDFAKDHYAKGHADVPSLAEIKKHIPAHCFKPSLVRSLSYVARDIFFIAALYYGAYLAYDTPYNSLYLPVFWFFTGFFMWAVCKSSCPPSSRYLCEFDIRSWWH